MAFVRTVKTKTSCYTQLGYNGFDENGNWGFIGLAPARPCASKVAGQAVLPSTKRGLVSWRNDSPGDREEAKGDNATKVLAVVTIAVLAYFMLK